LGVAFPEESLSQGEEVRLHLHPHWIVVFWPAVMAVITVGGTAAAAILVGINVWFYIIAAVALILFVWLSLAPYIVWRGTHYVFTNKQVLLRTGVLRREERGIPLNKVNNVRTTQGLLDRVLRCGTLIVESAGEVHGQSELVRIPNVLRVGNTLKELVAEDLDRHQLDEEELRAALKEHRELGGTL
jgi:uncharacterized membrane protein YdbT with pleckstrin-like domain